MDVPSALEILAQGGLLGAAVVAISALVTGIVVPRWVYLAMKEDRDYWRNEASNERGKTRQLTGAVYRVVEEER